jgi:hypothetical protein
MCLVENRRNFLSGNSVREGDIFLVDRDPVKIVVPNFRIGWIQIFFRKGKKWLIKKERN